MLDATESQIANLWWHLLCRNAISGWGFHMHRNSDHEWYQFLWHLALPPDKNERWKRETHPPDCDCDLHNA